ncbi:hypothetical protein PQR39_35400 [Paraburkholderia sediminicola]|uniref:hypothetical protein n=1 Tax=Paraburkholderia sediminicola TaxID=458836 RepID=UPI0038BCB869
MTIRYAVIFTLAGALGSDKKPYYPPGSRAWLTESEGYWLGKTYGACPFLVDRDHPPEDIVTFETGDEASKDFNEAFKGSHIGPWMCKPDGKFEVVPVRQKFKQVPDGYEAVK